MKTNRAPKQQRTCASALIALLGINGLRVNFKGTAIPYYVVNVNKMHILPHHDHPF